MKKLSFLSLSVCAILCLGQFACGRPKPPPPTPINGGSEPPISQPQFPDNPQQPPQQPPSQPPAIIISDNIGDLTPEGALAESDAKIISAVVNGSKELDNRRNRILLAADNYPGTQAELTYCVFDVRTRHLLGLAKKIGAKTEDMRLALNAEYTKANLTKHVDWVFADLQPGDQRAIFLSSHGGQDTGPDGSVQGLVIVHDMIATGVWSEDTEITLDYWKAKCKSVPPGCNVVLFFDCCYAGSDIRAALVGNPHASVKKSRSVDGPPVVQARITLATKRALMRDANQYFIQWFPACLESELSSEGSRTGGSGSWAFWSSVDKNGIDAPCTVICRDANGFLRQNQDSQHLSILGKNNKQPLFKAIAP